MTLEEMQKKTDKKVYQSDTNPNLFITYGKQNLTDIITDLMMFDLTNPKVYN